jgi:hypothetical protein
MSFQPEYQLQELERGEPETNFVILPATSVFLKRHLPSADDIFVSL